MSAIRIAIISPNRNAWSETFIQAHIHRLKNVELVLTDGFVPKRRQDGSLLLGASIFEKIRRRLDRRDIEVEQLRVVSNELKSHKIDVVLAEYGPTGEALVDVCKELGLPLVVHFHGVDAFHNKLLKEHDRYARVREAAAAIVTVSKEMEGQLLALGTGRDKLSMNYYGIDVSKFQQADPANSTPNFLAVGRFADTKAPYLTILAFHEAWKQRPNIRLTMVGQGPLMETCLQLRTSLGLEEAVDLPGIYTPDQVANAMRNARAFVQHSVITSESDREGTPLAVLEALSTGIPVIATKHAGIGEVVVHDESGLLCEERDVATMARHIVELADDPRRAAEMGKEGRKKIEKDHQLTDRIAILQGLLEAAVSKH